MKSDSYNIIKHIKIQFIESIYSFIENGAQIIETSSYQLSISDLIRENNYSLEQAKDIIRKSVLIADMARKESQRGWLEYFIIVR